MKMGRRCAEALRVAALSTFDVDPRLGRDAEAGMAAAMPRRAMAWMVDENGTSLRQGASRRLPVASLSTFDVDPRLG